MKHNYQRYFLRRRKRAAQGQVAPYAAAAAEKNDGNYYGALYSHVDYNYQSPYPQQSPYPASGLRSSLVWT
jgi:hypothetical protein